MTLTEFIMSADIPALLCKYDADITLALANDSDALCLYLMSRERGSTHRFAEMCAFRQPPGTKGSDRAFNEHARHRMSNMHGENLRRILKIAKDAGINTQGKYYCGGLGRYYDPTAWVSSTDEVLEVARKKNLTVSGHVEHQGVPQPPPKKVRLAEDLVKKQMSEYLQNPKEREKAKKKNGMAALRERVIEKHGAPKSC